MKRRNLLGLMGAGAAAVAAPIGTGAFSSTSAARTVSMSVVEDRNAYLKLIPDDDSGLVRSNASDGTIEFAIPGLRNYPENENAPEGEGVNPSSTYVFTDLVETTNQGTTDVELFSRFGSLPPELETVGLVGPSGEPLLGRDDALPLTVGEMAPIGLIIETAPDADPSGGRFQVSFEIVAKTPKDPGND